MRLRLALAALGLVAALLLAIPARAQNGRLDGFDPETLEYGCQPVIAVGGKTRLAHSPEFSSYDLLHPGQRPPVKLPRNTVGILCLRYSLVPFPDDHLILRRGLSLYIQAEYDRPAAVIVLLEMTDGLPRYSLYRGEATEREKAEIDAAVAAFPPF